ncbi:MAG: hypothetical protein IKG39_01995 [Lachnospiraceae bacterium]|nr:hypothetical protein [Lachnospiraceae bacterium]
MSRECDTCPEYKDYHCEKWCKVIRQTIADMKEDWIPINWIEDWLDKYPTMSDSTKYIVRWMVKDWQKEQEKKNGTD